MKLSTENTVVNLGNYDMKLSTKKYCFIHDFIFTLDDVTELKTV
jgi:hypothetical protein